MKKEILITKKLDYTEIAKIVDTLYDDILINQPCFKCIKIVVKFYDKNNVLLRPYLFLKGRENITRYKYFNYLFNKLNSFAKKNFTVEISKYQIKINVL